MEYSLSVTPLLVGGVTLFGLWLWYRNQKSKGLPPGPFSWPLLGNIPQLALQGKKPVFQIALAWREKYGDVFQMRMGAVRIVWVCGLELGREVLIDRGEDFSYRAKWMTMARESQRGQGMFEPRHDKISKLECAPRADSISLGIHAVLSESFSSERTKLAPCA